MKVDFQAEFSAQRAVMEEYRQVFLGTMKRDSGSDWYGSRELSVYRGKRAYRYHYFEPNFRNSNRLQHHPDCHVSVAERRLAADSEVLGNFEEPDWSRRAPELIEGVAQKIEDQSALFHLLLAEYEGFWWEALQDRAWDRTYFPGQKDIEGRDLSHLLGGLDLLFPEAQQEMLWLVEEGLLDENRKSRSQRGRNAAGFVGMNFVNAVREKLNRNLRNCSHVGQVSCILCGVEDTPLAGELIAQDLPAEICSWCLELFWYHPPPPLVRTGYGKKKLRTLMASAVRELTNLVELPYWKENVLTKKLVKSLRLNARDPKDAVEIIQVLSQLPRQEDISPFFESKAKLLELAGFEGHSQTSYGGHRSKAADGHLCLSIGERDICEFLFRRGIAHYKEPYYSRDPAIVEEYGHLRGDFQIENVIVEFAGLTGSGPYDEKMKLKVLLAETLNIPQIVLYPKDLGDLDLSLIGALNQLKRQNSASGSEAMGSEK